MSKVVMEIQIITMIWSLEDLAGCPEVQSMQKMLNPQRMRGQYAPQCNQIHQGYHPFEAYSSCTKSTYLTDKINISHGMIRNSFWPFKSLFCLFYFVMTNSSFQEHNFFFMLVCILQMKMGHAQQPSSQQQEQMQQQLPQVILLNSGFKFHFL